MTYSLGHTGRVINISIDEFLVMSDEDFQMYVAYEQGYVCNHPFSDSALLDLVSQDFDEEQENDLFTTDEIEEMLENDSYGDIAG